MTANQNSDGDRIDLPDGDDHLDAGLWFDNPGWDSLEVNADVQSEHYGGDMFGVGLQFNSETITFGLALEPGQARRLATRLIAAADKTGHVPDEDAPQPAEL